VDALACPPADHVAFGGPRLLVIQAGEAFISGNTVGVRSSDDVVEVASSDGGSAQLWLVVRGCQVVAVVDYGTLDGVACAGSGVGAA
jgi:hypothetical protein